MCGRYFFKMEDTIEFESLRKKLDQLALFEYATDEIFPSNHVLVMVSDAKDYHLDVMKWGITGYQNKAIINARSEGIQDKKTFKEMLHNRCLIPCNGFYEWKGVNQKQKQKVFIQKEEEPLFYMAGIYDNQKQFVILTGESQGAMRAIHHRTPIIITEHQIAQYFEEQINFNVDNTELLFEKESIKDTYQQIDLFEGEA